MPETDDPLLEFRDARPAGHEFRLFGGVSAVRFYADHFEVRRALRWRRAEYAADETFRADGRALRYLKLSLNRCGRPTTLWKLRPGRDAGRLARAANRLRRDATRRLNADVADPPWCFDCGYDRAALPPMHACPECGWRPVPGAVYVITRPRDRARPQADQPFWAGWRQAAGVGVSVGAIVLMNLGPPPFWPMPRATWTLAIIGLAVTSGVWLTWVFAEGAEAAPTRTRETLRLDPSDAAGRPLRLRSPGSFEVGRSRRRVRRLRLERAWPGLYRLHRPLRWYQFGTRFERFFEAAPRQAARVREALRRVRET